MNYTATTNNNYNNDDIKNVYPLYVGVVVVKAVEHGRDTKDSDSLSLIWVV